MTTLSKLTQSLKSRQEGLIRKQTNLDKGQNICKIDSNKGKDNPTHTHTQKKVKQVGKRKINQSINQSIKGKKKTYKLEKNKQTNKQTNKQVGKKKCNQTNE